MCDASNDQMGRVITERQACLVELLITHHTSRFTGLSHLHMPNQSLIDPGIRVVHELLLRLL